MYQSVVLGDDPENIADILDLKEAGPLVLDATYGHGGFWRNGPIRLEQRCVIGLDKRAGSGELNEELPPAVRALVAGDFEQMPFADNTFDAVIFDPPFMTRPGSGSKMNQRYEAYATYDDLLRSLAAAGAEVRRVLKPDGVAIVKCMDWVESRTVWRWLHIDIKDAWESLPVGALRLNGIIVKVRVTNLRNPSRLKRQNNPKAAHSYYLVFKVVRRVFNGRRPRVALPADRADLRPDDHALAPLRSGSGAQAIGAPSTGQNGSAQHPGEDVRALQGAMGL